MEVYVKLMHGLRSVYPQQKASFPTWVAQDEKSVWKGDGWDFETLLGRLLLNTLPVTKIIVWDVQQHATNTLWTDDGTLTEVTFTEIFD